MNAIHQVFISCQTSKLSDVLAWAEANKEDYHAIQELKKVPVRLGYVDADIAVLPADLAHFERKIAPSSYGAVSKSKNLDAARKRANARIRSLLQRFHQASSGNSEPKEGRQDWNRLIAWSMTNEGFTEKGAKFPTGRHKGLQALRARFPVVPRDINEAMVKEVFRSLSSDKRKSIAKGLRFLNLLTLEYADAPDLQGLLPIAPLTIPAGSDRARSIFWTSLPDSLRRSAEAAMNTTVAGPKERYADAMARINAGEDAEAVLAELNDVSGLRKSPPGNLATAVSGYKQAITWLVRAAEDAGHDLSDHPTLESLMTPALIEAAFNDQVKRSNSSEELKNASSSQTFEQPDLTGPI